MVMSLRFQMATAMAAVALMSSQVTQTSAMSSYLKKFPNGELFTQELAHGTEGYPNMTPFGKAFKAAKLTWDPTFCQSDYPDAGMTMGEAFGDPCCAWTKEGDPVETVTKFTDKPTAKTVCATAAAPAPAADAPEDAAPAAADVTGDLAAALAKKLAPDTPAAEEKEKKTTEGDDGVDLTNCRVRRVRVRRRK